MQMATPRCDVAEFYSMSQQRVTDVSEIPHLATLVDLFDGQLDHAEAGELWHQHSERVSVCRPRALT